MKVHFYSKSALALVAGLGLSATAAVAATPFGTGYRESWNSYPVGKNGGHYNNVWKVSVVTAGVGGAANYSPGGPADYPIITTSGAISTSRAIQYESKNRTIVNSLVDGIHNGQVESGELSPGRTIIPWAAKPLNTTTDQSNFDNFQMRHYFNLGGGTSHRSKQATYMEISNGVQHAPALIGALNPLAAPIPVLALGKLNGNFTGTGIDGANVAPYFFNGQQWIRLTAMGVAASTNGLCAKIFYDGGTATWKAYIQFLFVGAGGSGSQTVSLAFDPTVSGFDTVSYNMLNSGQNPSGTIAYDDVWVGGGWVTPEPSTMGLLALGGLLLSRRRARTN